MATTRRARTALRAAERIDLTLILDSRRGLATVASQGQGGSGHRLTRDLIPMVARRRTAVG